MFEESVSPSPTFWSSLTSWFTPTIFFLLLQLVIATIYIISSLSNNNNATHKHHQHGQEDHHETNHFQQQPLARSPSLLHRLKSINFYNYYPHHTHETQQPQQYHQHHQHEQYPHETNDFQQQPLARSPSLLQRLKSINFYSYYSHYTYETQQPQHHQQQQQQQQPPQQQQQQPQLPRSPSSVLQRLKSINLHTYFPTEPFSSYFTHEKTLEQPQKKTFVPKTPVLETEQKHKEEEEEQEDDDDDVVGEMFQSNNHEVRHGDEGSCASMDEIFSKLQQGQGGNFTRSHSDTKPESGEVPVRLPRKMKKSASTKSAFSHFEEGDIVESHRPATAREGAAAVDDGDGGVDAKADDFINRFKQQLKLQRQDSIMRYKEMIGRGRGSGK